MSYAREQANRLEAATSDIWPTCPRCCDLLEAGALICVGCGARVLTAEAIADVMRRQSERALRKRGVVK